MNLGLFILALSRRSQNLTVLAFEPAKETYDLALENLKRHGIQVIDHQDMLPEGLSMSEGGLLVHCFRMALSDVEPRSERACN